MLNTRMFVICTSGCLPSRHPDVKGGFTRVFKSFCRYFYEKSIPKVQKMAEQCK